MCFQSIICIHDKINKLGRIIFKTRTNIRRQAFKNDPSKLIDFVMNSDNALEAHEMGLLELDEISLEALKSKNDVESPLTPEIPNPEAPEPPEPKA